MRCSMSVSKPKTSSLATEGVVRYSSVHGERKSSGASTGDAVPGLFYSGECLRREGYAGVAETGQRGYAVYTLGAGSQDCLCGGIVQRLGQGNDANEASGR